VSGTPEGAVVFTDIVGFTEFTAEHGDGEALALLIARKRWCATRCRTTPGS